LCQRPRIERRHTGERNTIGIYSSDRHTVWAESECGVEVLRCGPDVTNYAAVDLVAPASDRDSSQSRAS
jgi:hypothetical protein